MIRIVKVYNAGVNIEREYTCEQWALMNSVPPAGWVTLSNTCPVYLRQFHAPYASFTPDFGAEGISVAGIRKYIWDGVVSANRVIIPISDLTLPSIEAMVEAHVNRVAYFPSEPGIIRDFYVNTVDNSIDFITGAGRPNLNGLKARIFVWK